MKSTKKLTLSAILVALGSVIMALGAMVEIVDLTVLALASLIVVFVYLEIGSPYTWLTWLATALVSFMIFPGKTVWLNYLLVFGIYPILKAYIERLPRPAWIFLKLGFINAVIAALFFLMEKLFGMPLFDSDAGFLKAVLYVLIIVAFFAYDMFITVSVRIYYGKIRQKFLRFLR